MAATTRLTKAGLRRRMGAGMGTVSRGSGRCSCAALTPTERPLSAGKRCCGWPSAMCCTSASPVVDAVAVPVPRHDLRAGGSRSREGAPPPAPRCQDRQAVCACWEGRLRRDAMQEGRGSKQLKQPRRYLLLPRRPVRALSPAPDRSLVCLAGRAQAAAGGARRAGWAPSARPGRWMCRASPGAGGRACV